MKIVFKDVSKKFKNAYILNDVNIEFNEGKIYGLIGRNGSGKSVLLKMLCGFYLPTSGSIYYDNIDIKKSGIFMPDTRALIEKPNFLPHLTGFENLRVLAKIQNKINDDDIINALEMVNLKDNINKKYCEYSLGMKQKLGIAQVLMENPKVMIFDEPFNGIEEETVKKIRKIILQEKNNGKIIVVASHMKDDIEQLADIVYKVDGGQVIV